MKNWLKISLITIILASIIHLIIVICFPSIVLRIVHKKISERAGGVNVVLHNLPTTAANNPIVNSSPDLLYSVCAFDLSNGPILFRAKVPDSYWSISGFDAETNNFFSVNNEQSRSKYFELVLVGPDGSLKVDGNVRMVKAPTTRGVVLFRTLVPKANKIEGLIRTQKTAICTPLQ